MRATPGSLVRRGAAFGLIRWVVSVVLAVLVTTGLGASSAAAAGGVSFTSVVNGQPSATSSDARPAQLYPSAQAQVRIKVTNLSRTDLRISTVRFQGEVLSLPLFSYDTAVDLVVPSGRTKSLTFPVALTGVGSQATGLVGATITLIGPNGVAVASQSLVTNVHGSIRSIYGLFGLVVLILTVSSLAFALLALARHTLSQNRWARGMRFLIPGFGVGLVLTFTLSVFHVFTPSPGHWLPLLIFPTAVGLALGFLTPAPNEEEYDDYDDDVLLAQIVVVDDDPLDDDGAKVSVGAVASTSGGLPDSRPTAPPMGLPDSRPTAPPTGLPDSRPTAPPTGLPDSRPTAPPTGLPDSRPTAPPTGLPDSRPIEP